MLSVFGNHRVETLKVPGMRSHRCRVGVRGGERYSLSVRPPQVTNGSGGALLVPPNMSGALYKFDAFLALRNTSDETVGSKNFGIFSAFAFWYDFQ